MNDTFNCAISPSIDLNHVLAPTIFLGLVIAFAAVYYTYVTQPKDLPHAQPTGNPAQKRQRRLDRFIIWSRAPALQRRYFMQVAAVCLGAGVFFLPAAFLKIADWLVFLLVALGLAGCLLAPGVLWWLSRCSTASKRRPARMVRRPPKSEHAQVYAT